MCQLLILGAGTAGTMAANRLRAQLASSWTITVVDADDRHHYQPGYLMVPFGRYSPSRLARSRRAQLAPGVEFVEAQITRVRPEDRRVDLADGRSLGYDWLVIASGTQIHPEQIPGLNDPAIWYAAAPDAARATAYDFYTLSGATALRSALARFRGGRIVVHIAEMPIKCPIAPLEFAFLADAHFRRLRMRHKIDISYVTPLDGAFTKPIASAAFGDLLDAKSLRLVTDFAVSHVDPGSRQLVGHDGREIPFDLLVTVPTNMGAQFVIDSGLGDHLGFVPVDRYTLRAAADDRIFALGDATNAPVSKAGAVAHFEVDHFVANFRSAINDQPLTSKFDGHANCFLETGHGRAVLLDFSYDTEPLPGRFPYPVIGPMKLLGESRLNHLGKLAFERLYWSRLLPGRALPMPINMSMRGKRIPASSS